MKKTKVAIIGAGPAGLAAALGLHKVGYDVALYERYDQIKAAGNILNLWPAPQKALKVLGVDTTDLGAPAYTELRRHDGHHRATFKISPEVAEEYNGGFIGLIRWGLYKRMIDALPPGCLNLSHEFTGFTDNGGDVTVRFRGHPDVKADILIGADGLNSVVRKELWGDSPKRHHRLHLLGGYFFVGEDEKSTRGVFSHNRTVQGSYTPIRHDGRDGFEWWMLEAWEANAPFKHDVKSYAKELAKGFADPLPAFIERTAPEHTHRWELIDRPPMKRWSKGRVTIIGDASHPTSPYAAYGAGMGVEDGYFLASSLSEIDPTNTTAVSEALLAFEKTRIKHCAEVTQGAYFAGKMFHHVPAILRPLRDFIFDNTGFLQKVQGDPVPIRACKLLDEIGPLKARTATN